MKHATLFVTVLFSLILVPLCALGAQDSVVFYDNFETSTGWIRNAFGTDNATAGLWERNVPEQTTYGGILQLGTVISGTMCLVTGRLAGTSPGDYDIDDGKTTVRSPNIALPTDGSLTLSFYYSFAHYNNATNADYLRVSVVGSSNVTYLELRGAPSIAYGQWKQFSADISSFAGQTVYLFIEVADEAEPSLVEAAVEDVRIVSETYSPPALPIWHTRAPDGIYNTNTGGVCVGGVECASGIKFEVDGNSLFNGDIELKGQGFNNLLRPAQMIIQSTPADPNNAEYVQIDYNQIMIKGQNYDLTLGSSGINCPSITAEQFRVGKWIIESAPDFVFAKEYNLRSLKEVERFIGENSHLPDVPSAREIKEEGIDLVEMNMTLLKKVEELFLYNIEQNKKIEKLEQELQKLSH